MPPVDNRLLCGSVACPHCVASFYYVCVSWINCIHVSLEAAVLPGGEEQGDWGSASENQRAGREPACLQRQ